MNNYLTVFFVFVCLTTSAQDILSSNTSIESCLDQKNCVTINRGSYLFYDETKNELSLKVDFSHFRSGGDTTDNWISDLTDSLFYYKAMINKEDFPVLSNQNVKTIKLNGKIFYNEIWKEQVIELTVYPTENSLIQGSTANYKYDNVKVNFELPFVPKDFKAYNKPHYNNQTISIAITLGRINLLRPGMESHLRDIYYQSTR